MHSKQQHHKHAISETSMVAFVYTFSTTARAPCDICTGTCGVLLVEVFFFFFLFIQETYGDEECSWWVFTVGPSSGRCDPDKSGRLPVTYLAFPEVKLHLIHHLLHLCSSVFVPYASALLSTATVPRQLGKLLRNLL